MGMTWARSGVAVLVPDHLGHGERRQHDFNTNNDFPGLKTASRQDYYFRYNSNLQLSAAGESLMGWIVWDMMRGVDVLLKQSNIDKDRIILLGSVAGGGDVAGVTAALDNRIACVAPFNFGGWQPESTVSENPDRDTPWFGDGYWESTRGLKNGARDGFAHFVIVGSVAPRKVIYAHEFAWEAEKDPAWPRLQKIFGFYDAKNSIVSIHGKGSVKGQAGPDNTHCTHIGAVHRKGIYPLLREWFGMPIPEEYSKRRPAEDLMCWTEEAKKELKPKKLQEVAGGVAGKRMRVADDFLDGLPPTMRIALLRKELAAVLGNIEPAANPKVTIGKAEDVPGGKLSRFALEPEAGITLPVFLITPKDAKGAVPVVVMVSQNGKAAFLKERGDAIAAFLKAGIAVCLPDVRGTGETQSGNSAARGSSRTVVSQTNLILGQPVLGSQLRDLRTVIHWLQAREGIDKKNFAIWGDSFAKVNAAGTQLAVPLDGELPAVAEPGGAWLAVLATLYEDGVVTAYARGGIVGLAGIFQSAYLYLPHEAVLPPTATFSLLDTILTRVDFDSVVDARNQLMFEGKPRPSADTTNRIVKQLKK
jgi:cephalosporin-C deacetylase-like acetyl esterase